MPLFFVGDSFVAGVGDPHYRGWVGRLCAQFGADLTLYNLGVRRETSQDIARRWLTEVQPRIIQDEPCGLVFAFGVNDSVVELGEPRVARSQSLATSRMLLEQAKQLGAVLQIGPPPIDDADINNRVSLLDQGLADVADQLAVPYLSVFDQLKDNPIWMEQVRQGDGAHPGGEGYEALARLIALWSPWQAWMDQINRG
ncbi:GDSL-type esterase/lipase family protein [Magnetococcus sp. PR-3]|uniref:GDSL-type esterase/lipase family protein n=1 Tax=Magnetococcus sp. PR-3 TaxID=3120355 RepID=UPI002FCE3724